MHKNRYLWLLGLALLMLCSQVYGGTWTPNQFFYKPSLGARGMTEKNNFNIGMEGVDTHLGKYKTLGDPGHSTLTEALATIGAQDVTLTIPAGTVVVNTTTTIPANVNLRVLKGGVFSVADGVPLNINGSIDAGDYQIFEWASTGVIALGQGSADRYYVQWWGAKGDNSTDCYPGLTKAIASIPSGGVLYFTSGTYKLIATSYLALKSNMTIDGDGMHQAKIYSDNHNGAYDTLYLKDLTNVIVRNICVDNDDHFAPYDIGSVSPRNCIGVWDDTTNVLFENVKALNSGRDGIYIGEWGGSGDTPKNVTVKNCHIKNSSRCGISWPRGEYINVEHNYVDRFGYTGIACEANTGTQITRYCKILGNTIKSTAADTGVVSAIVMKQAHNDGLQDSNHSHVISGNIGLLEGTATDRFMALLGGNRFTVFANNTSYGYLRLVSIYSEHSSVIGNSLYNTSTATSVDTSSGAIYCNGSNQVVQGNILYRPGGIGIASYSGCVNQVIEGNIITDPGFNVTSPNFNNSSGIVLRNASYCVVSNNIIRDTRSTNKMYAGIFFRLDGGVSIGCRVVNNTIYRPTNYYIYRSSAQMAMDFGNSPNKVITGTAVPTAGTFTQNDLVCQDGMTAAKQVGWRCITSGTMGTLASVTGSITSGLHVNDYITIAGVSGTKQITYISGTTVTLDSSADATVSGAAVAYAPASFVAIGTHSGATSSRPALSSNDSGFIYWDTDLDKAIVWDGSAWKNCDGTSL